MTTSLLKEKRGLKGLYWRRDETGTGEAAPAEIEAGACRKCDHYAGCEKPCYPVKRLLDRDKPNMFETNQGNVIRFHPPKRERARLAAILEAEEGEKSMEVVSEESPFRHFDDFKTRQTAVFVDRFFAGLSYQDLAVKYSQTETQLRGLYHAALTRLQMVLEFLDFRNGSLPFDRYGQLVRDAVCALPKHVKAYVMAELFGFTTVEVAKALDISPSKASGYITSNRKKVAAGELDLNTYFTQAAQAADRALKQNQRTAGRVRK